MLMCWEHKDAREEDESAIRRAELEVANAGASQSQSAEVAKQARARLDRLREHRFLYPHGRSLPLIPSRSTQHSPPH